MLPQLGRRNGNFKPPTLQPKPKLAASVQENEKENAPAPAAEPAQYFSVLYTKYAPNKKRKNKAFMDGFLEMKGGSCTLYDEDGKVASKGRLTIKGTLESGTELTVGSFELEIDSSIAAAAFTSGSCFLNKGQAVQQAAAGPVTLAAGMARAGNGLRTGFKRVQALHGGSRGPQGPSQAPAPLHDPSDADAVILNEEQVKESKGAVAVVIDPYIRRHLRPHQREGAKFLYECVMGLRGEGCTGAILADSMGLGKTIQVLTLCWTMLKQGPNGRPAARRCVVVCPSSLTRNWEEEARKWLGVERLRTLVVQPKKDATNADQINDFVNGQVFKLLILSYESARQFGIALKGSCDLLICDEGHRLKAAGSNKTMDALLAMECPRRVILTGTPIQNNLDEFFAMMNFVNPGLLGTLSTFKRVFGAPITRGQERDASEEERALGLQRTEELKRRVDRFVLRRTAEINQKYLPPLTTLVVWCRPTELQLRLYRKVLRSQLVTSLLSGSSDRAGGDCTLGAILQLRKICNHPSLCPEDVYEEVMRDANGDMATQWKEQSREAASGKMVCLALLVEGIISIGERVVVVSNSTQALDVIAKLCDSRGWSTVRIDGALDVTKRQDVVNAFNRCNVGQVFLLSTRAGGAGLNLVGANRLVLYDSDWNPAADAQAMARVWRDGQTKPCMVYRLLSTGTLEEKVYQRQLLKGDIAMATMAKGDNSKGGQQFTREELRELFQLDVKTECSTKDLLCKAGGEEWLDGRKDCSDLPLQRAVASGVVTWVKAEQRDKPITDDDGEDGDMAGEDADAGIAGEAGMPAGDVSAGMVSGGSAGAYRESPAAGPAVCSDDVDELELLDDM